MNAELIQRLKMGPTVLLLGQDYLRPGLATNPFIDLFKQRYPDVPGQSLADFLPKLAAEDKSAILAWLHRRSQKVPISESLATLSDFPWNHVYASAIDEVWVRAFTKNWRSLHSMFTEKSWPQDITGDELLAFINNEETTRPDGKKGAGLFRYLRTFTSSKLDVLQAQVDALKRLQTETATELDTLLPQSWTEPLRVN